MLNGRSDLGVLWDIRVHPDSRHCGIGTRLFEYAAAWLRERGGVLMKVETQNVNVPACRFYAKQECLLGEVNRYTDIQAIRESLTRPDSCGISTCDEGGMAPDKHRIRPYYRNSFLWRYKVPADIAAR